MSLEIVSDKQGAEAKQDAFDQATEQAAQKLTEELVGAEKAARYWPGLRSKILKNSARFVVFIKGSPVVDAPPGTPTKVTVILRLSTDNLESLLREEGILTSGTLRLLPLFAVADGRGGTYSWWTDAGEGTRPQPALDDQFKKVYALLASKMKSKNVYVLDPTSSSFRLSVPAAYRTANLRREDQILLAQYLKADVVLSGRLESGRMRSENSEPRLIYDLQLWQTKAGRPIGDFQRMENLTSDAPRAVVAQIEATAPKLVDEILTRLNEAVTGGNLNLNQVRLSVAGVMSYRQAAEFKRLLGQVHEIKVLKERLFEPGRLTYEVETSLTGGDLARVLQRVRFPLFNVEVGAGVQDDSLALNVRALASASAQ